MTSITVEERPVSAETRAAGSGKSPSLDRQAAKSSVTAVSGIVDAGDGRGYLQTAGYRRSPGDVPLTAAQIRQYGLRKGDQVEGLIAPGGAARAHGKGTRSRQQRTDAALTAVTAINGLPPDEAKRRPHFDDLTPVYPNERFRLEDGDPSPAARIIDLVSPIGKGQRGLPAEHAAVVSLRRALAALDSQHAIELLLDKAVIPNERLLRQIRDSR